MRCTRLWTLLPVGLLTALVLNGADDQLVGGPYAVNVTRTSATVMWLVETAQASLGTEPGKAEKLVPALRSQKVTFTGLEPGKTYYYDIQRGKEGKGSFKTAPLTGPYEFVVYGDTRTRHDVHRSIIAAILKHSQPDFVVHTGDQVANGLDPSLWPVFFDIERGLLRKAAFFPSLGNHERNTPWWYDIFDQTNSYYSFNWGNSHFSVLNTDIGNIGSGMRQGYWDEQVKWLRDDLEHNQAADFRFVVGHHPPMTAVSGRQSSNAYVTALLPIFEQYKVTAGFFGHDHNYQHYLKNGIHYFVTGGGGAPLYNVDQPPEGITKKVAQVENFMVVKIDGKTARFEAFRPDGETLDVAEIGKSAVAPQN
jgi:hypothetical protein